MLNDILYRLRALFHRSAVETEMNDELRFHFERQVENLVQSGLSREEAMRRARLEFGGLDQVKEECRQARGVHWLETCMQDIRYGLRALRKSPAFTAVAVVTLALGIGANTAIFSVANPVLFRPLPFRDPSRLVTVLENKPAQNLDWLYVTQISFVQWQRRQTSFESISAFHGCGFRMTGDGEPQFLRGSCVSSSFFPMLGIQPVLGRFWTADEDIPGNDHVAVISYATWKEQFGGNENVIGKTLLRFPDRANYTIIGVLPPDFQFVSDGNAVWAPPNINVGAPTRFHDQFVFARLKDGTTLFQAQSSMEAIARQLEKEFPQSNTGWGVTVRPLQEYYSSLSNTRTALVVLLGAVGALLLIACANVANLLLARAAARQQEIAVRIALGASRLRLVRQLLTESMLLGVLGGLTGFAIARAGFASLLALAPTIPTFQPHAIRVDFTVFLFSLTASMFVSILFGLAPALRVSRKDSNALVRQASRGSRAGRRDGSTRNLLVVCEVGLAVTLVIGSALLIQSLRNLANDKLGFASDHLLSMTVCCLEDSRYPGQSDISTFWRETFTRLRSLPGVEAVANTTSLPVRNFDGSGSPILIQGRRTPPPGHDELSDQRYIGPDYFAAMKITVLRGREFSAQDDETHAYVAVVNEAMVRRYWPDQDPIGQQVQLVNLQPFGRWFNVIGVVANSHERGLGLDTRPTVYVSSLQNLVRGSALLVRTKSDPASMASSILSTLRSGKTDLSFGRARTLDELLSSSLAPQRFSVTLLSLFTAIALAMALIGVYGVMAYMVAQRTHEIGLRMALGAKPRDMLKLVVGQGLKLASVGVTAGLVGTLASTRLLKGLLYGVGAYDPITVILVCLVLIVVALVACYLPARRAMRVDPMIALRAE